MDEDRDRVETLPAVVDRPAAAGPLVGLDDLERLRREVAAPAIVRDAGPHAEYAYADFFKAKISSPNTRKAYKRAVDRFLGWCLLDVGSLPQRVNPWVRGSGNSSGCRLRRRSTRCRTGQGRRTKP